MIAIALYGLASEVIGGISTAGNHLSVAQAFLGWTFSWVTGFDARLLGCPTIVVEPH